MSSRTGYVVVEDSGVVVERPGALAAVAAVAAVAAGSSGHGWSRER